MRRMELDAEIKNIMVIVPHEDDEILLAAGIMEKALAKGIGVHVVMAGMVIMKVMMRQPEVSVCQRHWQDFRCLDWAGDR